jgi:hypothetical protein
MARTYSANAKAAINSLGGHELPLFLLELTHPDLTTPLRVVGDTQDIISNGNTYTATSFRLTPPDDLAQGQPRARLSIDNVDRALADWIESSGGGKDATARLMQIMRNDPNVLELDLTMVLSNTTMTMLEISGELAFDDIYNMPACTVNYTPTVAPGLF